MRVCMVGTGRMAVAHTRALAGIAGVELDTAINRNAAHAEEFRREYGYQRAATSLDEALAAGGFDAVVITTPNPLHYEQAAAALVADKHVLCELPLGMSLAETEELARLADARDRRLMVCHTERFEPGRIELRRRVLAGELHPVHVFGRFFMLRRGPMLTVQQHNPWNDNVLWHHGAHVIDAMMDILGPHAARDLHAQFGPAWPSLGVPIDMDLQWKADSPLTGQTVLVNIIMSHSAPSNLHDYQVIALEDDLICSHGELRNPQGVVVPGDEHDRVDLQDAEFVDAVRAGRPPVLDAHAALPTMRIIQAAWDVWRAEAGA